MELEIVPWPFGSLEKDILFVQVKGDHGELVAFVWPREGRVELHSGCRGKAQLNTRCGVSFLRWTGSHNRALVQPNIKSIKSRVDPPFDRSLAHL